MTDQEFNRLNRMSKKLGGKYRRGFLQAFAESLKRTLDDMLGDDVEEKLYIVANLTTDLYTQKYFPEEVKDDGAEELEEVLDDEDAVLSFAKSLFSEEDDEAVDDGEVVVKSFKVKKEDFADLVKGRKNGRSRKD